MNIDLKAADDYNSREHGSTEALIPVHTLTDLTVLAQRQMGFQGEDLDGKLGSITATQARQAVRGQPVPAPPVQIPGIIDITATADQRMYNPKTGTGTLYFLRGELYRDDDEITGITLHQTACVLGLRARRWDTVSAHRGIMQNGARVHIHDPAKYVVHGHTWNNRCVGIEIDGRFPGKRGGRVWDDPTTAEIEQPTPLYPAQIEATKQEIRELKARYPSIKFLVAHRQSSHDRDNDPGWEVWEKIALPMHKELGLSDAEPGNYGGSPIPEDWDPSKKGVRV